MSPTANEIHLVLSDSVKSFRAAIIHLIFKFTPIFVHIFLFRNTIPLT